jgi:hypothetical protein
MGTFEIRKGHGGRFAAAELGWFKQRKWYSVVTEAHPVSGGVLLFRRKSWNRIWLAEDTQGRVVGEHDRQQLMRGRGPVVWESVQYELARHSAWKGSFVLSRYDEELARFTPHWIGSRIEVEVPEGQRVPPAGLLLFCAWITLQTQRDNAAAASG